MNEPLVSPSLWVPTRSSNLNEDVRRGLGAFEIKYLVECATANRLFAKAEQHMPMDPHANPRNGDTYQVESLYFDTPQLDVYHRSPGYGRKKFRVRRYGDDNPTLFAECKSKRKGRVSKRREVIQSEDISALAVAQVTPSHSVSWFAQKIQSRNLHPTCQVRYLRRARMTMEEQGPIRITMDIDIVGRKAAGYAFGAFEEMDSLFPGFAIVEFKFRLTMPRFFQSLIDEFQLIQRPLSKYRSSLEFLNPSLKLSTELPSSPAGTAIGHEAKAS